MLAVSRKPRQQDLPHRQAGLAWRRSTVTRNSGSFPSSYFFVFCETRPPPPPQPTLFDSKMAHEHANSIQAGTMVRVHSLQSAAGKELNDGRALVLRFVESAGRWECRMELEQDELGTKAFKPENLKLCPRKPLPGESDSRRGLATDMENLCPKLCELLVYFRDKPGKRYRPSEIMLGGYGGMAFSRMDQWNFEYFNAFQMEQMAGALGLANICKEGDLWGTESVLVALVEGDPMYMDVLAHTMYWTGQIKKVDDSNPGEHNYAEWDVPPTQLTPDQDYEPYVKTMAEGPYFILKSMNRYVFKPAFWAAMRRSEFAYCLAHRFLRILAREAKGTKDGRKLGKIARASLVELVPGVEPISEIVSVTTADHILQESKNVMKGPSLNANDVNALLQRD